MYWIFVAAALVISPVISRAFLFAEFPLLIEPEMKDIPPKSISRVKAVPSESTSPVMINRKIPFAPIVFAEMEQLRMAVLVVVLVTSTAGSPTDLQSVVPPPELPIAVVTNCVVASCVVFVLAAAVGAAGTPVKVGLAVGAIELFT